MSLPENENDDYCLQQKITIKCCMKWTCKQDTLHAKKCLLGDEHYGEQEKRLLQKM